MSVVDIELSPVRPSNAAVPLASSPVQLPPPVTEITSVADLDAVTESVACSCSAGDDNPF